MMLYCENSQERSLTLVWEHQRQTWHFLAYARATKEKQQSLLLGYIDYLEIQRKHTPKAHGNSWKKKDRLESKANHDFIGSQWVVWFGWRYLVAAFAYYCLVLLEGALYLPFLTKCRCFLSFNTRQPLQQML